MCFCRRSVLGVLVEANTELARYDGLLLGGANTDVLISPLLTQEATLSSRIEGTQATVEEVLEQEAGINFDENKNQDIIEILNYRQAMDEAVNYLKERPITLDLIRGIHKTLLNSARGQKKSPGIFKTTQNHIGPKGGKIEDATFVPVCPLAMREALANWQDYIESDEIDCLIQTAIVHAQFELIHPFDDGNGRLGRILITLFLFYKKKISTPMFYLSSYLEENREEYIQRLNHISKNGDWNGWIEFILIAITKQAKLNCHRIQQITMLYEEMKTEIQELTHSQYTIQSLDAIFKKPIFKTSDFITATGMKKALASKILKKLKDGKVLTTLRESSGRRSEILCFPQLLLIAEGHGES